MACLALKASSRIVKVTICNIAGNTISTSRYSDSIFPHNSKQEYDSRPNNKAGVNMNTWFAKGWDDYVSGRPPDAAGGVFYCRGYLMACLIGAALRRA